MTKLTEGEHDHIFDRYNDLSDYIDDLYIRGRIEPSEVKHRDGELARILGLCADKTYKVIIKKLIDIRNVLVMYEKDDT